MPICGAQGRSKMTLACRILRTGRNPQAVIARQSQQHPPALGAGSVVVTRVSASDDADTPPTKTALTREAAKWPGILSSEIEPPQAMHRAAMAPMRSVAKPRVAFYRLEIRSKAPCPSDVSS